MSEKTHAKKTAPQKGEAINLEPNSDKDLDHTPEELYIGQGGDLRITTEGGHVTTFERVGAGTVLRVKAKRIHDLGTGNVRGIVGIY